MLQLNPNEIIRLNKLINNSINTIDENILFFKTKYIDDPNKITELKINEIEKDTDSIKNSTLFLNNIINELVEATGEDIDKLMNANHSLNYFENRLVNYYAENINNNVSKNKLDLIELCYAKDEKINNLCKKHNFIEYLSTYFTKFKPEEYGLDKNTVITELVEIYDKRGASEAYSIMKALENNCPSNFHEYHFNPKSLINNYDYYDFNEKTIINFQSNSEIININGYNYEITQVLPKDCTKIERLAYDFGKANIINTMRTLPDKYLKLCQEGNSNTIILTFNKEAMNNNANWSGYYKPTSFMGTSNNNITIDIHGSFNYNEFYTQDTLIHEMGHKFDDVIHKKNVIDWLFGNTTYSKSSTEWNQAYKKYKDVLNTINIGGYVSYPNVNEFFGDATVAYFKDPDILKSMCPEVYELMNNVLDGEYGYSYNERLLAILNVSN